MAEIVGHAERVPLQRYTGVSAEFGSGAVLRFESSIHLSWRGELAGVSRSVLFSMNCFVAGHGVCAARRGS
jgi:hypothetical protein